MAETDDLVVIPPIPKGLRTAGRRFWRQIHSAYEFQDAPEVVLLVEEAARTADVVARLQEIVDTADDLRTRGSRGQDVCIPELDALRAYRAQFAALIKQLDLPPVEDTDDAGNGDTPMSRSESGRKAAEARWGPQIR
jgi:hypothetical protein